MKRYSFFLDERELRRFFICIRSKVDIIELLMRAIVVMLLNKKPFNENQNKGELVLLVSKMSRLFFFSENKSFSVNFPFAVLEGLSGELSFSSKLIPNIDHKITSDVIGLVNSDEFVNSNCIYQFNDRIAEIEDTSQGFWSLIKELLLCEDGYIRYDYDKENQNEKIHPLNHLDVFYSSHPTFKIGLQNKISNETLIDLLDLKTDCHYLDSRFL